MFKLLVTLIVLGACGYAVYRWPLLWIAAAPLAALAGWMLLHAITDRLRPTLERGWELLQPRSGSARAVIRRSNRARRQHGLASPSEVWRHGSGHAVTRNATVLRPSLDGRRVRPWEVGVELCRVGAQTVWAPVEDVVLALAGPRQFKSQWMATRIVDYPGPVVATSIRLDLYINTQHHRRASGPMWVFNAGGVATLAQETGQASPIAAEDVVTFDPLTGCHDPDVASERATDMIPATTGDAEKWAEQARLALSALLHAAALADYTIDTVHTWVSSPVTHKERILRILRERSPARSTVSDAAQFLTNNEKTQTSITTSIIPALKWLQSTEARVAAGLDGDGRPFEIGELLAGRGTLYVLGRVEDHVTPLMSALTGYVARNARRASARTACGRLDPPLGLLLDEAHQLKPPLPDWTADMGGSGITVIVATQSRARMVSTWGADGADIILNNAGAVLLGGGTKAASDLEFWSNLAGKRDEVTVARDRGGKVTSRSQRQVPVLEAAQLANLAPGRVVVFRRGMPPALGRVRMLWQRRDLHDPATSTPPVETPTSTPPPVEARRGETTTPPWRAPSTLPVEPTEVPDVEVETTDG